MAKSLTSAARRCLIVERHQWETGGGEQQLQFPLQIARTFFGSGTADTPVTVRVFLDRSSTAPTFTKPITISREYANGTRRTNGFPEMGGFPTGFIFFEETETTRTYDVWCQPDTPIVVARFRALPWVQGRNTQHGRGRLAVIAPAPVLKIIDRL